MKYQIIAADHTQAPESTLKTAEMLDDLAVASTLLSVMYRILIDKLLVTLSVSCESYSCIEL